MPIGEKFGEKLTANQETIVRVIINVPTYKLDL